MVIIHTLSQQGIQDDIFGTNNWLVRPNINNHEVSLATLSKEQILELVNLKSIIKEISYGEEILNHSSTLLDVCHELIQSMQQEILDHILNSNQSDSHTSEVAKPYLMGYLEACVDQIEVSTKSTFHGQQIFDKPFNVNIITGNNPGDILSISLPKLINDDFLGNIEKDIYDNPLSALSKLKQTIKHIDSIKASIKDYQSFLTNTKSQFLSELNKLGFSGFENLSNHDIVSKLHGYHHINIIDTESLAKDQLSTELSIMSYKQSFHFPYISELYNQIKDKTQHLMSEAKVEELYYGNPNVGLIQEVEEQKFINEEILQTIIQQQELSWTTLDMGVTDRFREVLDIKFQANIGVIKNLAKDQSLESINNAFSINTPLNNLQQLDLISDQTNNYSISNIPSTGFALVKLENDQHKMEQNIIFLEYLLDKGMFATENQYCGSILQSKQLYHRFFYKTNENDEADFNKLFIMPKNINGLNEAYCNLETLQNLTLYKYLMAQHTTSCIYTYENYKQHELEAYKLIVKDIDNAISNIARKLYDNCEVQEYLSNYNAFLEFFIQENDNHYPQYQQFKEQPLYDQVLEVESIAGAMKNNIVNLSNQLIKGEENYIDLSPINSTDPFEGFVIV